MNGNFIKINGQYLQNYSFCAKSLYYSRFPYLLNKRWMDLEVEEIYSMRVELFNVQGLHFNVNNSTNRKFRANLKSFSYITFGKFLV